MILPVFEEMARAARDQSDPCGVPLIAQELSATYAGLLEAWSPLARKAFRYVDFTSEGFVIAAACALARAGKPLIGKCRAVFNDIFWSETEADAGVEVVVMPIFAAMMTDRDADEWYEIVDIVAWRQHAPAKWYLMTGNAGAIGCVYGDAAVRLWATPAEWHRSGGRGCCILRLGSAGARRILLGGNRIETDDVATVARWQKRLVGPVAPIVRAMS